LKNAPIEADIRAFRVLEPKHIQFLERHGFRPQAPRGIFVGYYLRFFQGVRYLPRPDRGEAFYSHLIHCLLVDVEMLTVVHYFQGLGLARQKIPLSTYAEIYDGDVNDLVLGQLGSIHFAEVYGRPFVDFMVIMLRAQWDKLTRLMDLAFGLKEWSSISDGLLNLQRFASTSSPDVRALIEIYVRVARERLDKTGKGWLRPFRDSLLHKVGQHSVWLAPQRKSAENTTDFWNHCLDEYDYLREAFFIALIAISTAGFERSEKPSGVE